MAGRVQELHDLNNRLNDYLYDLVIKSAKRKPTDALCKQIAAAHAATVGVSAVLNDANLAALIQMRGIQPF